MISIGSNTIKDSIDKLNQTKFHLLRENLINDITLEPLVRNIISTITFDKLINLNKLEKKILNSIYEPNVFAGLRYKIREGLSALIFSSGKVVVAGSKSVEDISYAYSIIRKYVE